MPDRFEPLKIAMVGDWFLPRLGGIELQTRDLSQRLIARGHSVRIISSVKGPPEVEGLQVDRLPGLRIPRGGILVTPDAYITLNRHLKTGGYDVVHVQFGIMAPVAHIGLALAASAGLPAVATFHSALADWKIPMWLLGRAFGYGQRPVRYGGVSSLVTETMRPLIGDAPSIAIANGIDLAWWQGTPKRPETGPVDLVSVMRLHRRKRPKALIESFAAATKDLQHGMARLTIYGDGPERQRLLAQINRLGLADTITLPGSKPRETIRAALHRAHAFVLASKLEAFGIASLEARAAGLPVVTTRQSGARDFLVDGHDSLLAADDAEFARHLRRLITEPDTRNRLTLAAATPPSGVDWRDVVPRYEDEYRAAIALAAARRGKAQGGERAAMKDRVMSQ